MYKYLLESRSPKFSDSTRTRTLRAGGLPDSLVFISPYQMASDLFSTVSGFGTHYLIQVRVHTRKKHQRVSQFTRSPPTLEFLTRQKSIRQQQQLLEIITLYRGFTASKRLSKASSLYAPGSPLMCLSAQSSLGPQGQSRYTGVLCRWIQTGFWFMGGTTQNAAQEASSSARSNRVPAGMGRSSCLPLESECLS